MKFNESLPIYIQIMEELKYRIITGEYHINEKIESVRELAIKYQVNPNTVQKAFLELEKAGLVYSNTTSGRFITTDQDRIDTMRKERIQVCIEQFFLELEKFKLKKEEIEEIEDLIMRWLQDEKYNNNK